MPRDVKFFIGGGGDTKTRLVRNYQEAYQIANPGMESQWFPWDDGAIIMARLMGLPEDAIVTVIGHSYGGDTAFSVIRARRVNLLISIDPVGRFKTPWDQVRPHCRRWINVRAEPTRERRNSNDTIAWIGGKYGRPPEPGQPGAPDFSLFVNTDHGDFSGMMRATNRQGISAALLLGGRSVL